MTVSTLGRYQIVAQLGRGAMGTVYRAVDPAIERTVAIKTLNPDLPDENMAEVRERFLREAKSAGRLNHPNVVTIYDVGEAGGIAYIAMEYLEGQSLRQLLDSAPALSPQAVSNIVAQIADALDYAQRFGIVHRDIKPANIMLSPTGHAKLADFGVAYMPSSSMTQTGTVLGSPKYLSPEQVLGLPVDGRADIFALGTVLFEMLTGKTPFERPDITVYALMQRICTDPLPRVSQVRQDVPAAFDMILARAMGKRPEERYQRASEFAADLRNFRQLHLSSTDETIIGAPVRPIEATVALRPEPHVPSQPAKPDPELEKKMEQLLSDLDTFSTKLDMENLKLAEEAKRYQEARARAEEEAAQPLQGPAERKPRSALIGLLQEQAKAKTGPQSGKPTLESVQALSEKLRHAFDYLAEFVREFNAASPAFGGKLSMPYAGNLPQVTLGTGFVDFRTMKFEDKQVLESIALSYHMTSDQQPKVTVNKDEARILKLQLDRAQVKYTEREVKQFFQKMAGVELTITCQVFARVTIKVDYNTRVVDFLCQNLAMIGASRYRFAGDQFGEDVMEEFGKKILGLPNRFADLKLPDSSK